ncbi:Uncharacterised protein [Mycobacteroides abscessus]|nr:Uncharacterised protein [Mycobacteroides abscessus]CQA12694.1 Uncharacterised protein [Mycobacteroides abscessus]
MSSPGGKTADKKATVWLNAMSLFAKYRSPESDSSKRKAIRRVFG